ncbi:aminodeoxychorismate lyase [Marinagarivorans algicola]|uniref:aminodeoxychorismate lyase n=1 Tax=Marinagarivorans algicola TaxID=1513270 RepID=UPI0006B556F2|nr:aminodeoxychorismate lyase [Marinagarivorans algicola]
MAVSPSCRTFAAKGLWQLNGQLRGQLPVQDRGLAYGDGLFETCLLLSQSATSSVSGTHLPCWSYHKARLLLGCERLGLPVLADSLEQDLQHFLKQLPSVSTNGASSLIKLIVTRGQGGRGYAPPASHAPVNVLWQFLPAPVAGNEYAGVHLTVSDVRLARQPLLAGLKHLNRLEYVLAAQQCSEGSIPLLLDTHDCLIESLAHNIFCVVGGVLRTPVLDQCGVKGVLREIVMQKIASNLGLEVSEQVLTQNDLAMATEVFIGNSVRGIWPVTEVTLLDGRHLQWPVGSISTELQHAWLRYLSLC